MALSVIIVLYVCVGILAAAGSIFISQKLFSAKTEQIFFALFLVAIAAFYLAVRLPVVLIMGYSLHGIWDVIHETHAYGGDGHFSIRELTSVPLAYGAFCAAYDWCVAGYFYTRRREWNAAWKAHAR
jgi:hypothetical protein